MADMPQRILALESQVLGLKATNLGLQNMIQYLENKALSVGVEKRSIEDGMMLAENRELRHLVQKLEDSNLSLANDLAVQKQKVEYLAGIHIGDQNRSLGDQVIDLGFSNKVLADDLAAKKEELAAKTQELAAKTQELAAETQELAAKTQELKALAHGRSLANISRSDIIGKWMLSINGYGDNFFFQIPRDREEGAKAYNSSMSRDGKLIIREFIYGVVSLKWNRKQGDSWYITLTLSENRKSLGGNGVCIMGNQSHTTRCYTLFLTWMEDS
jgi:hypothetical protein